MKLYNLSLFLLAALPMGAVGMDALAFTPSEQTVGVGDTFTVGLDLGPLTQYLGSCGTLCFEDISNLYAYQLELDFDPSVLQAVEVDEGTFLPATGATTWFPGIIDNTGGSISFIIESLESATGGADTQFGGLLLSATFQAIGATSGSNISIAPGACFQTFVDVGTTNCSITSPPQNLDTSAVDTVTVVTPEPSAFELGLAALGLGAMIDRLRKRARKSNA